MKPCPKINECSKVEMVFDHDLLEFQYAEAIKEICAKCEERPLSSEGDLWRQDRVEVAHEDDRRRLSAIFNGDFVAQQVKIVEAKKDTVLGNHYHTYSELFYVLQGEATYYLKSVNTGEKKVVTLRKGDKLVIAPEIAHKAEMTKGTITIEATEQLYMSPEVNDVRYEVE